MNCVKNHNLLNKVKGTNLKDRPRIKDMRKRKKHSMNYDKIINEIYNAQKRFERCYAVSLSIEMGVPETEQPVLGYSRAYSKMFFNYAVLLLHDEMLRLSMPNHDIDYILNRLAELRPMPRNVLDNYIDAKEEIKPQLEAMYCSYDAPKFITELVDRLHESIKEFVREYSRRKER